VAAGSPVPRAIIERPPGGDRRDIRSIAARTGLHLFYAPAMRNGAGRTAPAEDRGMAILSTLPLDDLHVIELPFERQRRVAVAATVTARTSAGVSWQLRVVDVQIDTSVALTRGGPMAARRRQSEALVDALAAGRGQHAADGTPSASTPVVVGGDFNTWFGGREAAVEVMRRAFPDAPRAGTGTTWRGPLGMHAALDHLFLAGHLRSAGPRRLPERFGSDHYPLSMAVDF
jgi:endonuclease/exonuclease/phosphatase family metal-dependent hydrolase